MSYTFRIKVTPSPFNKFGGDTSEIDIPVDDDRLTVKLSTGSPDIPFSRANNYVLIGSGFDTQEEAQQEGQKYKNNFMAALAKFGIGVDFCARKQMPVITEGFLGNISARVGTRILEDKMGLMVYETSPQSPHLGMEIDVDISGRAPDDFPDILMGAMNSNVEFSDHDLMGFTLYHAAFFQPTKDTRFLLLMMSIESVCTQKKRSNAVKAQVNKFLKHVKKNKLIYEGDKASMEGSIDYLKKESIQQACRRVIKERLSDKMYKGESAIKVFSECYSIRSKIAHGSPPSIEVINNHIGALQQLALDLLTAKFYP